MNDNNALGAVRDYLATAKGTLAEVHVNTPQDTIVRRGRARRRRYRFPVLAGAIGVAAARALRRRHRNSTSEDVPGQPSGQHPARGLDGHQAERRQLRCFHPQPA